MQFLVAVVPTSNEHESNHFTVPTYILSTYICTSTNLTYFKLEFVQHARADLKRLEL